MILFLYFLLFAETAKMSTKVEPKVESPAPIIPPELEIRYLRIAMEKQFLKTQLDASIEKEKKVTQEIISACGKDYTPEEKERLVCVKKEK